MPVAVANSESAQGQAALRLAAAQARRQHTDLLSIRVVDDGETWPDEAARRTAEARVDATLAAADLGEVPRQLLWAAADPDRAATLVDCAVRYGADLLVIGARRRSPLGSFLLGSTVQRVVLDAPMPVFVVKAAEL